MVIQDKYQTTWLQKYRYRHHYFDYSYCICRGNPADPTLYIFLNSHRRIGIVTYPISFFLLRKYSYQGAVQGLVTETPDFSQPIKTSLRGDLVRSKTCIKHPTNLFAMVWQKYMAGHLIKAAVTWIECFSYIHTIT